MRKILFLLIAFLVWTGVMPMMTYAGEWKCDSIGWWWQNDDGSYPAGGWEWLDGNCDRVYECYYFDQNGYMMSDIRVSDGGFLNGDGAWVLNGKVQTRKLAADAIDPSKVAACINALTNQERKRYGLSELAIDEELRENGQVRAQELVQRFDHVRPDGNPFHTVLTTNYTKVGENIIYTKVLNQITEEALAKELVRLWLGSDAHKRNILTPEWKQTAISIYIEENTVYVVQLFLTP